MPAQYERTQITNPAFTHQELAKEGSKIGLFVFTIKDFLFWWYLQMPVWYLVSLKRVILVLSDKLSLTLLLQTFSIPWHRDYRALGIVMGYVMRFFVIPMDLLIILLVILVYLFFILVWAALPIISIFFIITSIFTNN